MTAKFVDKCDKCDKYVINEFMTIEQMILLSAAAGVKRELTVHATSLLTFVVTTASGVHSSLPAAFVRLHLPSFLRLIRY